MSESSEVIRSAPFTRLKAGHLLCRVDEVADPGGKEFVFEGKEGVVDDIRAGDTVKIAGNSISLNPVVIKTVTLDTFGVDYPAPVKLPDTPLRVQLAMIGAWVEEGQAVLEKYNSEMRSAM